MEWEAIGIVTSGVLGLTALILGLLNTRNQRRSDASIAQLRERQVMALERMADRDQLRDTAEQEGAATVVAAIRSRQEGQYVCSVVNRGPSEARSVKMDLLGALRVISAPSEPINLASGESVSFGIVTAWQTEWPLVLTLAWDDPRGAQDRVVQLHRPY